MLVTDACGFVDVVISFKVKVTRGNDSKTE